MPYRFKLESLLRLQRSIERQEENRLLACTAEIVRLNALLNDWKQARFQKKENLWSELGHGSPAAFLHISSMWEQAVCLREKQILEQLRLAEQARQHQMEVYRGSRRKRETLESLRQHDLTQYTIRQLHRIQQELDETHLMRSFYQVGG